MPRYVLAFAFAAAFVGGTMFFSWLAYRFWIGDYDADRRVDLKVKDWFVKALVTTEAAK